MKQLIIAVVALLSVGCVTRRPTPPPPPPPPTTLAVAVVAQGPDGIGIPGALVGIGAQQGEANHDGYRFFDNVPVCQRDDCRLNVHAEAKGYISYDGLYQTFPGMPDFLIRLAKAAPPLNNGGEQGRVRVEGVLFKREDGSIFPWRGCTDFLAFQRFRQGQDLTELLTQRIAAGCNTLRVLGMVDSFSKFRPDGDGYYADLGRFADLLAVRGLRFEFVAFADAQVIIPDGGQEQYHLDRVVQVLGSKPNAFLEIANESFKNIPGGYATASELGRRVLGRGVLVAYSSLEYDVPNCAASVPIGDYATIHPERKPDWVRTAKDLMDLREGWGWPEAQCGPGKKFRGTQTATVADEPIGAAENDQPGRRSNNAEWYGQFGAIAQLEGAGATFHSDQGILSELWTGKQLTAAMAFFDGLKWVPPAAQVAPYQRGSEFGGQGIGNMPMEHLDTLASRTFCKPVDGVEWCVAAQPQPGWRAIARDGWRVVQEPMRGLVALVR